ncbi:metallophosphoesterase [Streptomyces fuscigenes]|uniref:metallophosphoesterase n=1 Tax=Streptomyces fuscigenes TaxID=1528880 RepID=UPI001F177533|nr:metallophosphoesterase [Streptomyces fuscigenes]MCF3961280.1 metallophosphoesterase [Streptomyces fuscigenes]
MTQGADEEPVVRTATLRDFRVPPYAQVPVGTGEPPAGQPASLGRQEPQVPATTPEHEAPLRVPAQAAEPALEADQPPAGRAVPVEHSPTAEQSVAPVHPGNAIPDTELPEGYTPTERDLPIIGAQAEPAPTLVMQRSEDQDGMPNLGPLYVVGDVHGYLEELLAALAEQGLVDGEGHWSAGTARLWFLGDFTDRGPDGVGVIDLVMRLSAEAAAAGGYCKALMGNHELLLLGAKRFGPTPVSSGAGTATFHAAWLLNGGQQSDMERLQDVHLQWMSRLDAVAEEDGHLLMHSDTTAYLDYGTTIDDVNDTVHQILTRNDADECWELFRKLTKRFAFRDDGPEAARELLSSYGGGRIVHGHSPIPYLLGDVGAEDPDDGSGRPEPVIEGPHVYAEGLAVAMDGGVTMAGKLLVVQLPLHN